MGLPSSRPLVCVVTGGRAGCAGEPLRRDALVRYVQAAARAGVDLVQIREFELADGALLELVGACVEATRGTGALVLVNERADIACAAGAAGVHLRAASASASRVRAMVPASFVVGRSVHSPDEAEEVAAAGGLDYLTLGTVFRSASKPPGAAVLGTDALVRTVRAVPLPVLAIGGVRPATLPAVAATGAAGIAAIDLFDAAARGHEDTEEAIRAVLARIRSIFSSS